MGCQTITPDATVTINAVLLRQVLAQVEQHPETWQRPEWRDGPAPCISDQLEALMQEGVKLLVQVHHVTIRIVPEDELILGERMPDGRAPLEVLEHRPGLEPMTHGGERGMPAHQLRAHARAVADRLGVPYIDPIDPAAMERLTRAEAA